MKLTIEIEHARVQPQEAREFLRSSGVEPDGSKQGALVDCILVRVNGELKTGVAWEPVYRRWAKYDALHHAFGPVYTGALSQAMGEALYEALRLNDIAHRVEQNFELMKAGLDAQPLPDVVKEHERVQAQATRLIQSVRGFAAGLRETGEPLDGSAVADGLADVVAAAVSEGSDDTE